MRKIIIPGEKVADHKVRMENTFIEGEATYAATVGMLDEDGRFIPLEGIYKPLSGDLVVGLITDSRHSGYGVDINLPSSGFISSRDTRVRMNVGEIIMGRIKEADEVGSVDLTDIRRLPKGNIIPFPPAKIPRLIGKKSSMINMIKEQTKSDIVVGNNGYVWIGENADIPLVMSVVNLIIKKAHVSGLTDEMAKFLSAFAPASGTVAQPQGEVSQQGESQSQNSEQQDEKSW